MLKRNNNMRPNNNNKFTDPAGPNIVHDIDDTNSEFSVKYD
jgi:hypothetical protein